MWDTFACATANVLTHFIISIAVLENVPPDAGLQKRVTFSTLNVGIVFHVDNQATLKALDSTDKTKNPCKETRETPNKLGRKNTVVLEWVKSHVGILGNKEADRPLTAQPSNTPKG
jgi:hypothetical protein